MCTARILAAYADSITLAVSGHVGVDTLTEIERLIGTDTEKEVVLDLSEVTLLDRDAAAFLFEEHNRGVKLVNCPPYLKDWILGTRK